jgi:hypothetical protein
MQPVAQLPLSMNGKQWLQCVLLWTIAPHLTVDDLRCMCMQMCFVPDPGTLLGVGPGGYLLASVCKKHALLLLVWCELWVHEISALSHTFLDVRRCYL